MLKRCFAVVAALLLVAAVLSGQRGSDPPTFKSSVELIDVDVLVTDKDGNPVRDLTKEDFAIYEDDQLQALANFVYVDLPVDSIESRRRNSQAVESDVTSNTGEGRTYVMLYDASGPTGEQIARRFIEEAIGAHDQVAIVPLLGKMSDAQGFTNNRGALLAAIDRIQRTGGIYQGDPTKMSFQVAEELFERLGSIGGRRKIALWFNPPSVFQPGLGEANRGQTFMQRDAVRAATRNNIAIYVISSFGLMTDDLGLESLERRAGLRVLADDTGGDIIVNTNNFASALERFVRDNSSYYVLGYAPVIAHRDGQFHTLNVRVRRPGVTVRARRGYYAPNPGAETIRGGAPPNGLTADTLAAVMRPASSGRLGIDLFATPFKGPGRLGSVLVGAQLRGSDLTLAAGENMEIAFQATTTEGKISPGKFHVVRLDFTPSSRSAIEQTGVRFLDRLELPPGRHQVRFAVHQPNGKTGSVVADVEVPNFSRNELTMSGIVLTSEGTSAQRTLLSDGRLHAILGGEPTVRRRFSRSDTITAYAEIYQDVGTVERLGLIATLTTAAGARARSETPRRVIAEAGSTGLTVRFPLAGLGTGDYVLTLEARTAERVAKRQVALAVE